MRVGFPILKFLPTSPRSSLWKEVIILSLLLEDHLSIWIIWNSFAWEIRLSLAYLLTQLFYLYPYGLVGIYFTLRAKFKYFIYLSNYSSFGNRECLQISLSLWHASTIAGFFFLSISLLSGTTKYSRLILCIPCPSPRINHFFKEPCPLLLENGIRKWDLDMTHAHCYWASRL